jgi:hypothetical protein
VGGVPCLTWNPEMALEMVVSIVVALK